MSTTKVTYSMIDNAPVNVKDFGAVGNGSHDDTVAIQAALTAGAGKQIYIPSGTYLISSQLNISSNTTISGESSKVTIIKAASSFGTAPVYNTVMLLGTSVNGCTIENISLDGSGVLDTYVGAGTAIRLYNGIYNNIVNVTIKNIMQCGIEFWAQTYGSIANVFIDYAGLINDTSPGTPPAYRDHGMMIFTDTGKPCAYITVDNVYISNSRRKAFTTADASAAGITNIKYSNCSAVDSGLGGFYITNYSKTLANFELVNCVAKNTTANTVQYQLQSITNLTVTNCISEMSQYGIYLAEVENAVVSSCIVKSTQDQGIFVYQLTSPYRSKNVTISNCQVIDSDITSPPGGTGIYVGFTDNGIVSNNIIYDNTPITDIGIYINSNCTNVFVENNLINNIAGTAVTNLCTTSKNVLSSNKVYDLTTAKAWVKYNGTTQTILGSFNIQNVGYNGVGYYGINFSVPLPDTNFCVVVSKKKKSSTAGDCIDAYALAVGTAVVKIYENNVAVDPDEVFVVVFGN